MEQQIELERGERIARLLFPETTKTVADYRKIYPPRILKPSACITRVAPSPTGPMHIGGIYMALICKKIACQTGGLFYLRIEDTDKKRTVVGAKEMIINSLNDYGLLPDEGPILPKGDKGFYAPYIQSERLEIYKSFAKELIKRGLAYPCFATEAELEVSRKEQEILGVKPGYYGKWATWRNMDVDKVQQTLYKKVPYVIRLYSSGNESEKFTHHDIVKGVITMPTNHQDFVLVKGDGLPTYHLAHVVDDYLMGTTHVIRGDEWLSSLPLHYELFQIFGFPVPCYGHIAPIQKVENGNKKRKLSKRIDSEAKILYYREKGYPEDAVIEYLMNLANSNFEDWRRQNPQLPLNDFKLSFDRFSNGGPLFDELKLKDISKNIIARMDAAAIYQNTLVWAQNYDPKFAKLLVHHSDYALQFFAIERGNVNARKDIAVWSDMPNEFSCFFDENFVTPVCIEIKTILTEKEIIAAITAFCGFYNQDDNRERWFERVQTLALQYDLAPDIKSYKQQHGRFRGQVGELTQVIRYALTGKTRTPDLYSLMVVMGYDRCINRLKGFIEQC